MNGGPGEIDHSPVQREMHRQKLRATAIVSSLAGEQGATMVAAAADAAGSPALQPPRREVLLAGHGFRSHRDRKAPSVGRAQHVAP